mgnify:CR=1 FL=1
MKKHSKMYVEALGNVDKNKEYDVTEAIKVLKSLKTRKFDESVDLAMNLNIDAKKTDMNIRGSFVLPNGTGKAKRVLVITKTKASEASEAEYCGAEDMLEKIEKEMKKISKDGKRIVREEISKEEALEKFKDDPYKIDLISRMDENEVVISCYTQGDFTDLCRGPHVETVKVLKYFTICFTI